MDLTIDVGVQSVPLVHIGYLEKLVGENLNAGTAEGELEVRFLVPWLLLCSPLTTLCDQPGVAASK